MRAQIDRQTDGSMFQAEQIVTDSMVRSGCKLVICTRLANAQNTLPCTGDNDHAVKQQVQAYGNSRADASQLFHAS